MPVLQDQGIETAVEYISKIARYKRIDTSTEGRTE